MRIVSILLLLTFAGKLYSQTVNFKYDRVENFSEGMAQVYIGDKTGYIDITGKEVVPVNYDKSIRPYSFTNGMAIVQQKKLYGAVDKTGKLAIPCIYVSLGEFSEGLAEAGLGKDRNGYINTKGEVVVPLIYERDVFAHSFKNGYGIIKKNDKYGYVNKKGVEVIAPIYSRATFFSDNITLVEDAGKDYLPLFLNTDGKRIINDVYDDAYPFINGYAGVNKGAKADAANYYLKGGGQWGAINKSGEVIIPLIYDHIDVKENGLFIVRKGVYNEGKRGVINTKSESILPVEYYKIYINGRHILAAKEKGKAFALFEYTGKQLTDFTLWIGSIYSLDDEYLVVKEKNTYTNDRYGFVERNQGKLIIPYKYDSATRMLEGVAAVKLNGKWGAIDKTGKGIIPPTYEYMGEFHDGWAMVRQNGKYGFINKAGKLMELKNIPASIVPKSATSFEKEVYTYEAKIGNFIMVNKGGIFNTAKDTLRGGKFGLLDTNYNVLIPVKYDYFKLDTNFKIAVTYQNYNITLGPNYERGDTTDKSVIGILGMDGKEKHPFTLSKIRTQGDKNQYIVVTQKASRKHGIFSRQFAKLIVPVEYELIYDFTDSIVAAKKNGKLGAINLKHEVLLPFEYDSVFTGKTNSGIHYKFKNATSTVSLDIRGKIISQQNLAQKSNASNKYEPHQSNFEKAFNEAKTSEEKGKAYAKYLEAIYPLVDSISFSNTVSKLNTQIAGIDFYAIYQAAMSIGTAGIKIISIIQANLTTEQKKVFREYSECILDNFSKKYSNVAVPSQTNNGTTVVTPVHNGGAEIKCPPAHTPQPGQPWNGSLVNNNTSTEPDKQKIVTTPAPIPVDDLKQAQSFYKQMEGRYFFFHSERMIYYLPPGQIFSSRYDKVILNLGVISKTYNHLTTPSTVSYGVSNTSEKTKQVNAMDLVSWYDGAISEVVGVTYCNKCYGNRTTWDGRQHHNCTKCKGTGVFPSSIWNNGSARDYFQ